MGEYGGSVNQRTEPISCGDPATSMGEAYTELADETPSSMSRRRALLARMACRHNDGQ
jgi:hypothetical protein